MAKKEVTNFAVICEFTLKEEDGREEGRKDGDIINSPCEVVIEGRGGRKRRGTEDTGAEWGIDEHPWYPAAALTDRLTDLLFRFIKVSLALARTPFMNLTTERGSERRSGGGAAASARRAKRVCRVLEGEERVYSYMGLNGGSPNPEWQQL